MGIWGILARRGLGYIYSNRRVVKKAGIACDVSGQMSYANLRQDGSSNFSRKTCSLRGVAREWKSAPPSELSTFCSLLCQNTLIFFGEITALDFMEVILGYDES